MDTGWICPRCKASNAPFTPQCPSCTGDSARPQPSYERRTTTTVVNRSWRPENLEEPEVHWANRASFHD